jgi:DNA-binding transcriptional MocR family regulator
MRGVCDTDEPEPAYLQLERQMRLAIADGVLQPGDRLPSERATAARLGARRYSGHAAPRWLADGAFGMWERRVRIVRNRCVRARIASD